MARQRKPKYRRQRRRGKPDLAFVELAGTRYYLGEWGTRESKQEYRRLLIEWAASGGTRVALARRPPDDGITVVELANAFRKHAESYYRRRDGSPSKEAGHFLRVLAPLTALYGRTLAAEFGPLQLKAVRQELIERGKRPTPKDAQPGEAENAEAAEREAVAIEWSSSADKGRSARPVIAGRRTVSGRAGIGYAAGSPGRGGAGPCPG